MLCSADETIPIFLDVFRRPTNLRNNLRNLLGCHHFNGIPRTDFEFVRVRLFTGNVYAHFAAHAPFNVNLAPTLQVLKLVELLHLNDAINWTDLQTGLAAGAVIGIDNGQFFGELFTRTLLCHRDHNRQWNREYSLLNSVAVEPVMERAKMQEAFFPSLLAGFPAYQILGSLAGPYEPCFSSVDQNLGRQWFGVVIARHCKAIGTGYLNHQIIADGGAGQGTGLNKTAILLREDVPRFA